MGLRATRAEINLSLFKQNIQIFQNKLGSERKICLAVKGNAYGHGLIPMSHVAQNLVDMLAVATVDEGVQLRESGIICPILLLSIHTREEIPSIVSYHLTPLISHDYFLEDYQYWAYHFQCSLAIHIKVDTGMGRAGFFIEEVLPVIKKIQQCPNLLLEGIATHFAVAGDGLDGQTFTEQQIHLFSQLINSLKSQQINIPYIHAANGAGILHYPSSYFTMGRFGIGAYGYEDYSGLKPVLALKTKISIIKTIKKGNSVSYGCTWKAPNDTQIGILPIGYADGYFRNLSNKGKVLINDTFYSVVGRVCMDQMMIAIPKLPNALGKDVLLYGDHPNLNAHTIAELSGTISYEVLTAIAARVPRKYI